MRIGGRRHAEQSVAAGPVQLGGQLLAEDLTANTFMVAWRKHTELTLVRESVLPWLYTVASNLAHTELRKNLGGASVS